MGTTISGITGASLKWPSTKTIAFTAIGKAGGPSAPPPHAHPSGDDEIAERHRAPAAATDLALIVYEVPVGTGRPLPPGLLRRVLGLPNAAGIKLTSTDLLELPMLRRSRPGHACFFGFGETVLAGAALGTDGGSARPATSLAGSTSRSTGRCATTRWPARRRCWRPRRSSSRRCSRSASCPA